MFILLIERKVFVNTILDNSLKKELHIDVFPSLNIILSIQFSLYLFVECGIWLGIKSSVQTHLNFKKILLKIGNIIQLLIMQLLKCLVIQILICTLVIKSKVRNMDYQKINLIIQLQYENGRFYNIEQFKFLKYCQFRSILLKKYNQTTIKTTSFQKNILLANYYYYYINIIYNNPIKICMEANKSFLEIPAGSDFSYANIPFGVYSHANAPNIKHPCTRIGDSIIDLSVLETNGHFQGPLFKSLHSNGKFIFQSGCLNQFMALDRNHWIEIRQTIQQLFKFDSAIKNSSILQLAVHPSNKVHMHLPAHIGDYSDFYSSRSHAFNVGSIIRGPNNALQQNWFHIPIGYHGRSSSIVISGTDIIRPRGQIKVGDKPIFSQCKRLDFEIQIGYFVGGKTNELGHSIKVNDAWNNIFGFVLLNDWSFRDFQTWQYVPLGPFTAKNGATTISPWIVTIQALTGAEIPLSVQDPQPLPYLNEKQHKSYDINIALDVQSSKMQKPQHLIQTNMKHLYWSCAQQLAHHSISGCNMRPGDMLGTGTISGDQKESFGSLLELTWGGKNPWKLGEEDRVFLQDGDTVTMRGWATVGGQRIGFGECSGKILPPLPLENYY